MKKEDPKLLALMENCFDAGVLSGKEQAQRKPLTDERIFELASEHQDWDRNLIRVRSFARAIEAAHGITGEKK